MQSVIRLLEDESGASAAEYALILAIVGSGLAVAALFLGRTIGNSMNTQAEKIANCTTNSANC
jgi:pilus assembly protein Flp/PilA